MRLTPPHIRAYTYLPYHHNRSDYIMVVITYRLGSVRSRCSGQPWPSADLSPRAPATIYMRRDHDWLPVWQGCWKEEGRCAHAHAHAHVEQRLDQQAKIFISDEKARASGQGAPPAAQSSWAAAPAPAPRRSGRSMIFGWLYQPPRALPWRRTWPRKEIRLNVCNVSVGSSVNNHQWYESSCSSMVK